MKTLIEFIIYLLIGLMLIERVYRKAEVHGQLENNPLTPVVFFLFALFWPIVTIMAISYNISENNNKPKE